MRIFNLLLFAAFFTAACGQPKPLNYKNDGRDIIAFGDSLTYGYGAEPNESYPAELARLTGKDIINLGVSGNTALDGLNRIKELDGYRPYMVLIEFGANDYMRKRPFEQTQNSLKSIVDYVQQKGAVAVIIDTGGPGMGKYSDYMKDLAKQKRAVFVPAILKGIFTKRELKSDMVHPNAKGYKLIAQKVHKHIKEYL